MTAAAPVTPALLPPVVRAGQTATDSFALDIAPVAAGWSYSGLRVIELAPGATARFSTGPAEALVLPLRGGCTVTCDSATFEVAGRADVFAGTTDFVYLPLKAEVEMSSPRGGRFAIPSAVTTRRLPARYQPASAVAVELRGAGAASRQVHTFCAPEEFEADRMIAVEVLTPGGNWSSYPPHKHEGSSDAESQLEEIYYFEVAGNGAAYQRVYSSGAGREIEVLAEVRTGDVVLVPYGYHGPSIAAPGYDLYYLNVMAGPGERAWRFCDDPAFTWIRGTWADQPIDPRLPLAGGSTGDAP